MSPPPSLDNLRRFAVANSLFAPTTLPRAIERMGFVQADPIRAPARAQDLILRHRVKDYRAGNLERQYESLEVEEDFFVNYGYVTRAVQVLMHPRPELHVPAMGNQPIPIGERKKMKRLLEFVEGRGAVHPRDVEAHFEHGRVTNYWGGSSHATTQMLDVLHYRGKLRVARREKGIRLYRSHRHEPVRLDRASIRARIDALVDVVVNIYAPLPGPSLSYYVRRLRYAVPQWAPEINGALRRAKERLAHVHIGKVDWYWPSPPSSGNSRVTTRQANPFRSPPHEKVRLLAPFDPIVHDRSRFESLWGWVYRFEAYTPPSKRKLGYYALPLLWRDQVIGWANLAVKEGMLRAELGYVKGTPPRDRLFKQELEAELERIRVFLGAERVS